MQFLYDVQRLIACGDLLRVRRYVCGGCVCVCVGGGVWAHTHNFGKFKVFLFNLKLPILSQN